MKPKRDRKKICQTMCVITGAALLILPTGVTWYWGNVSILALSYIVSHLQQGSDIETPWIVSLYIVFRALGLISYDFAKNMCGNNWIILIGVVISDVALFSCYFAVQNSLMLLNVALGVFEGFGSGLLYGNALYTVVSLSDKHVGLTTSIIQGSFAAGAIAINEFVTLYANPDNLSPNLTIRAFSYFTQKELVDKVPSIFLIMGAFSVASHLIAALLLNQQAIGIFFKANESEKVEEVKKIANTESVSTNYQDKTALVDSLSLSPNENRSVDKSQGHFSPKEVLKTYTFYTLWFAFFVGDFPVVLIINYYKSFAQIHIHDDHFLTDLGTTIVFFNAWIRGVWGLIMDRIGAKNTLVILMAPLVVVNVWFYFSAMNSKWIYFFTCFVFATFSGALYGVFPAVMVQIFGKTHFSMNFGLLTSASIVFNLVGPVAIEAILANYGWFVTFTSSAVLNTMSLFLMLKFIP